jgi:Skp family chaperone for outer membrane proteins
MRLKSLFAAASIAIAVPAAAVVVTATSDAHAVDANVVYVDLDRAVSDCGEGRQAEATLVIERNKRQPDIQSREAKLKKMEEELRRKLKAGDQVGVEQMGVQIQADFAEYQRLTNVYQRELNELEHKLYDPIEKRVKELLRTILVRDGYDGVMSARGVAFGRRDLDITQKVITEYNQKYPVAATTPAATTTSAAPAATAAPAPSASASH